MKNHPFEFLKVFAICLFAISGIVMISLLQRYSGLTFSLLNLVLSALIIGSVGIFGLHPTLASVNFVIGVQLLFLGLLSRSLSAHMHFIDVFLIFCFVLLVSSALSHLYKGFDVRLASAVAVAVFAGNAPLAGEYSPWFVWVIRVFEVTLPAILLYIVPVRTFRGIYRKFYLIIEPPFVIVILALLESLADRGMLLLNSLVFFYIPFIAFPASVSVLLFSPFNARALTAP